MSVFAKRLKEARLQAGLSQEALGIEAGLDPASASTRMNRYELGKRAPDFELVERIAEVLEVPAPYFYATDDTLARIILAAGKLSARERAKLAESAELAAAKRP
ncbi:helix-turn-helix transcriptional regulator [Ramlibacter sp.]|uniref:helix-turn-helix domain-containing protein n=1 Tax=Ramlibacter sp. TaxID=1917967 RepID=UPI0017EA12CC|nr:helix-turn-helix transcriptional regulator [Ramlibacter sp.]MBA2674007.1 helix-turn-helix transcriptional regulator [Ramlibacter sp.]